MTSMPMARARPGARASAARLLVARYPTLAIAAAWSVVAVLAAVQTAALVRLSGGASLTAALLGRLAIIPLWAAATPLVLRSARRFPLVGAGRRVSPAHLGLHLAAGSAFLVLANVLIRLPILLRDGPVALERATARGLAEYFPAALLAYAALVAIGHLVGGAERAELRGKGDAELPAEGEIDFGGGPPADVMNGAAPGYARHRNGDGESRENGDIVPGGGPPMVARVSASAAPPPDAPAHIAPEARREPRAESREHSPAEAPPSAPLDCLPVRQWNRVHLVRIADIDWIAAEDNYVVVHAGGRGFKGRERIADVESRLDARRFVRIHRSTIVHVARIREVQPLTHGDHAVILRDGTVLRVARSRRQALASALALEL